MGQAFTLVLTMIGNIAQICADVNLPFIYMFALAIVLIVLNNIYFWVIGGKN